MPFSFNPFTSTLDLTDTSQSEYYLIDENSEKWKLTVDTAGVLTTVNVNDGSFDFMGGADMSFMGGADVGLMSD